MTPFANTTLTGVTIEDLSDFGATGPDWAYAQAMKELSGAEARIREARTSAPQYHSDAEYQKGMAAVAKARELATKAATRTGYSWVQWDKDVSGLLQGTAAGFGVAAFWRPFAGIEGRSPAEADTEVQPNAGSGSSFVPTIGTGGLSPTLLVVGVAAVVGLILYMKQKG